MSKEQGQTVTLTESLEPTAQDVQLVHDIILRAQQEPLADDRLSLFAAYEAVLSERDIDPNFDQICYWLLLEILKPEVEGDGLYAKFENVLRNKGMEVVFTDDELSVDILSPSNDMASMTSPQRSAVSRSVKVLSRSETEAYAGSGANPQTADQSQVRRAARDPFEETPAQVALLMQQAIAMDRRTLQRLSLQELREKLHQQTHRRMEQHADSFYKRNLAYKVLTHWQNVQRQVVNDYAKADAFRIQHRRIRVLGELLDSARINRLQAMEEERLRGLSLYRLTLAARESAFRSRHAVKLKQRCLHGIMHASRSMLENNTVLEHRLQHIQRQLALRSLQRGLTTMTQVVQTRQAMGAQACRIRDSKITAAAFEVLTKRWHHSGDIRTTADNNRDVYLSRKYFTKLKEYTQARKSRRTVLAKWCLKRWQKLVAKNKHNKREAAYRDFRREYKMRLARRCLLRLTTETHRLERVHQEADQFQYAKTNGKAHSIVVAWYNQSQLQQHHHEKAVKCANRLLAKHATDHLIATSQRLGQLRQTASRFQELQVESMSVRCLRSMGRKAFDIRRRQQDADAFQARQDRHLSRKCVDKFRRRLAESRGEGPLILPPATPAQRRADQLYRLASTTPIAPPMTSFATRLRDSAKLPETSDEFAEFDEDKT